MGNNHILLLDPSIGTNNVGDEIIMECAQKELEFLTQGRFVYRLPTHVSSFHWYQIWKNSLAVRNYAESEYKFVCGSNLLMKDMLTHYPQWNLNLWNCKPFQGSILLGVGASAGDKTNLYTRKLYDKFLSKNYFHSVRDERSKEFMEQLGFKAINTGCVTMWKLTPDFCKSIPISKASRVVFTLTAASQPLESDQHLIDILQRNYKKVYFWVQGDKDMEYFGKFRNTGGIIIVPPTKEAYHQILCEEDIEYVGTRLHAGVYAMRHSKRAVIIVIDERAREINRSNNLICMERDAVATELEKLINSEFKTEIKMPREEINRWRAQFLG